MNTLSHILLMVSAIVASFSLGALLIVANTDNRSMHKLAESTVPQGLLCSAAVAITAALLTVFGL